MSSLVRIFRATVMHTPANPFHDAAAFKSYADGALVCEGERICDCGEYDELRRSYPQAEVLDLRGSYLLPGFVDTHVHFPQLPVIGAMGLPLLEWLKQRTLPAEAALCGRAEAAAAAALFLERLAANGTSTALVFGSHLFVAQDAFFLAAAASGLRISSGLVLGDRNLLPELETTARRAEEESRELISRYHGKGRLRYAVTPRFSVSCSNSLLAVCGELLSRTPKLMFQTHINENHAEIACVRELFPGAHDYLQTYEEHELCGSRSVFAHNLHPRDAELSRMAQSSCSVAHCPSSNAFLGSGSFPMARHLEHGVPFGTGCDVGAGSGFSLLGEGLRAYETQMLRPDGQPLQPRHLLYLSSAAGAEVLGLSSIVGDFAPGKEADFVVLRPPPKSTAALVLKRAESCEDALGILFTLAREESVQATYVAGKPVYSNAAGVGGPVL